MEAHDGRGSRRIPRRARLSAPPSGYGGSDLRGGIAGRLSKRSTAVLRNAGNILELSSISLAEIAIKAAIGKLAISDAIVRQAIEDLDIRVLPFTAEHALRLYDCPYTTVIPSTDRFLPKHCVRGFRW